MYLTIHISPEMTALIMTVFCKAQARKNKQDKCESLNRVKKVLPSLAPFQLGIFSNVAGSPHGDVVFDWVVNCVTAIAQGLVDGKIPASQQIYNRPLALRSVDVQYKFGSKFY